MFGNEFARTLMNTHAVQKNKGESQDDTMRHNVCARVCICVRVCVCVSFLFYFFFFFFLPLETLAYSVSRAVKSG